MAGFERLDKIISNYCTKSRTKAKDLIRKGEVRVDDRTITDPGYKINPETNKLALKGKNVEYKKHFYYMLNKPTDVVSAVTDNLHQTVIDLLKEKDKKRGIFPVGRLDIDTEGLIILTNNGKLSHSLLSPKKHVEKEYIADIVGEVNEETIKLFKSGLKISDDFVCKPATLKINSINENKTNITIVITEGKFHQVKRMFEAVDCEVVYLKRVRMAEIMLDNSLLLGQYRELTKKEIDLLEAHK